MYRENEDKLENIIFKPLENGDIETYIAKYNLTSKQFKELTISEQESQTPQLQKVSADSQYFCVILEYTVTVYGQCEETHSNGYTCEGETITYTFSSCTWSGGGGNGSDSEYDNPSSNPTPQWNNPGQDNYNGGSDNNGGISTTPVLPCRGPDCPQEFDPIHDKNCNELHKFSSSAYAQNEFIALEGWIDENKEKGYFVKANPTDPTNPALPNFTTQYGESPNLDDCAEMKVPYNIRGTTYAIMHVHPTGCNNGTYGMFHLGDLRNLYLTSQYYNPNLVPEVGSDPSIYAIYMTVAGYHYALKINDPAKLANLEVIFNDKNKRKTITKNIKKLYRATNNDQSLLTKALLKIISENNLGISLYRSSHDDIQVGSSNWKRLTLDNNDIVLKDCNQN